MWLSDFCLVLPDRVVLRGSVRIEDGSIAEIVDGVVRPADVYGDGLTLMPGIIDLHGDMLEREIEPRPNAVLPIDIALFELDKRMVATGVTTPFAAVSFHRTAKNPLRSAESAQRIIQAVSRLRDTLLADFRVHARFEVTNPTAGPVVSSLIDDGHVHLVSLTDHTPGQGQYRDIDLYVKTMLEWRARRGVDDVEETLRRQVEEAQARPKHWEIVRDVVQAAARRGVPVSSHDDDSPEKVAFVTALGATISEFPVSLESARAAKSSGMHVIMGAPNALLGRSNTNNLAALDAIRDGVVDILAADYHPAALLQSAHRIVADGLLPWPEAVKLISLNPATAARLTDRGSLEPGKRADVVVVEIGDPPRVRATLRQGEPVFSDGTITAAPFGRRGVSREALATVRAGSGS
jgi:alpha-D-ribose 1-methylphosphonate 5-triphosphate diphosphatase